MSGGGKTSQNVQTVELPPELEAAAKQNLQMAEQVGKLPYAPNFGMQVAAFTPMQEAAMANSNAAASAYGLQAPSDPMAGMPAAETVNGMRGYTTQPYYEDAMSKVDPSVMAAYNQFFGVQPPPAPAAPAASGGGGYRQPTSGSDKGGANFIM